MLKFLMQRSKVEGIAMHHFYRFKTRAQYHGNGEGKGDLREIVW